MSQSAARRAKRIAAREAPPPPAEFTTVLVSLGGGAVSVDHQDWDGLIEQLKAARRIGGVDQFAVLRHGKHHAMLTDLARRTVFPEGLGEEAPPDLAN